MVMGSSPLCRAALEGPGPGEAQIPVSKWPVSQRPGVPGAPLCREGGWDGNSHCRALIPSCRCASTSLTSFTQHARGTGAQGVTDSVALLSCLVPGAHVTIPALQMKRPKLRWGGERQGALHQAGQSCPPGPVTHLAAPQHQGPFSEFPRLMGPECCDLQFLGRCEL